VEAKWTNFKELLTSLLYSHAASTQGLFGFAI